ncbi:MAG: DUF6036 family nucleotidyltransferase [Candidatus Spechtbacterales bacterium]|nr:DUF6036 family nucleotidyltransferase [Candidatus Spechtbacterales bacterium]
MSKKADPREVLKDISKILEELNINYIVTGGLAVVVWGRPRYTADIDTVVEMDAGDVNKLAVALRKLGKAGYINEDAMHEALKNKGEFNFIDGRTGMKIDFWIATNTPFDKSRMERKTAEDIKGQRVYFTSPEDLIISKLQWYALSESTRHIEDIESVLDISRDKLDMDYLKKWAAKLDVNDILDNILAE